MESHPTLPANLPPRFDARRLAANLDALGRVNRALARRLAWPCGSDHVGFGPDGAVVLHWRRTPLRIDLEGPRELPAPRRPAGDAASPGWLFGLGQGEPIEAALASDPTRTWIAWERDPWLLRLTLARLDLTDAIRSGRLQFALGSDLLAPRPADGPIHVHPTLGQVYARELSLLEAGAGSADVLLAEGGLFVDQLGAALARRGHSVFTVDLERLSLEELGHCVRESGARKLFAINYTHGLAEFAAEAGLELFVWEIDPSLDELRPLAGSSERTRIFTYRAAHVAQFRASGFEHVQHLPLAADTELRQPVALEGADKQRYGVPLAFVGSSMVAEAGQYRTAFLDLCAAVRGEASRAAEATRLDALLERQRARPTSYQLVEWIERIYGDVLAAARATAPGSNPVRLLADVAAADKRLVLVGALGSRGIHVWGDSGWDLLGEFGVHYRGPAGHQRELNRIYSGGGVQLDVNRIYQPDIVTMRVFDVLACGGFCLTEHSRELDALFDVGVELDSYRGPEELIAKVDHYLAHPGEARAIAARGLAAVRERHTIDLRLDAMLRAQASALSAA